MADKSFLKSIEKTEEQKQNEVLHNIALMLSNRRYVDGDELKPVLNLGEEEFEKMEDDLFKLVANNDTFLILFSLQITKSGKQQFKDFVDSYPTFKKIIVKRYDAEKSIVGKSAQIFSEDVLLEDIISHRSQPKFEYVHPKDIPAIMKAYNMDKTTIHQFNPADAVVKYFNLRKSDVLRIVRQSPTSGQMISYRIHR